MSLHSPWGKILSHTIEWYLKENRKGVGNRPWEISKRDVEREKDR